MLNALEILSKKESSLEKVKISRMLTIQLLRRKF